MLILFDIDQTLISTRNYFGRTMFIDAFRTGFGIDVTDSLEGISFAGRTDLSLVEELRQRAGLTTVPSTDVWQTIKRNMEDYAVRMGANDVDVIPGAADFLRRVHKAGHTVGLVTGNIRSIAYRKLAAGGYVDIFVDGAFGCDFADRSLLPPLALQRINTSVTKPYTPENVIVVGDAPGDVTCALDNGMTSLAVATGSHSESELRALGAHIVVPTLDHADVAYLCGS